MLNNDYAKDQPTPHTTMAKISDKADSSSFRDPSGTVFYRDNIVFRQINESYAKQYDFLLSSGLYDDLTKRGNLITHTETEAEPLSHPYYKVIAPHKIPFISYPYEWCFDQLKDAALLTLKIHRRAMDFGMILKDASAYNVQFIGGNATWIDSLSFDFYEDGMPWVAYGQFCRHFMAPLFLMSCVDLRFLQLLRIYIDGIPLDLAAEIMGTRGGMTALQHIKWHAKAALNNADAGHNEKKLSRKIKLGKFQHLAMIDSMIKAVSNIKMKNVDTEWGNYGRCTSYTEQGATQKSSFISGMLKDINPSLTWDLGANDGTYTRLALIRDDSYAVAFDIDPLAVERNYVKVRNTGEKMIPVLLDVTNPSPGIGFSNQERVGISERGRPDCIMLLAVIHHLAISNNLPLDKIAKWLASLSDNLIIEFVPKEDPQVKILLATRTDIFTDYCREGFELAFSKYFTQIESHHIADSTRIVYRFRRL